MNSHENMYFANPNDNGDNLIYEERYISHIVKHSFHLWLAIEHVSIINTSIFIVGHTTANDRVK